MERRTPSAGRRSRAARLLRAVLVLIMLGVVVLGVVWAGQRALIYVPDRADPPPVERVLPGAADRVLHTSDGLDLRAWFLPAQPGAAQRRDAPLAVLYLPGNGGNRAGRARIAEELSRRGLSVLLVDYRGYGGNPGRPSEAGLARDALAAQEALVEEGYPADRQIYVGESLGAGVASTLAAERPPAGLVLRSPFTDLADLARVHYPWLPVRALLREQYPVLETVRALQVPVTVVRGTADTVVPGRLSEQVARAAPRLAEDVVLDGVGHNDPPMFGAEVADAVARLADRVGRTG